MLVTVVPLGVSDVTLRIEREPLDKPKRSVGFRYKFADGSTVDQDTFPRKPSPPPGTKQVHVVYF